MNSFNFDNANNCSGENALNSLKLNDDSLSEICGGASLNGNPKFKGARDKWCEGCWVRSVTYCFTKCPRNNE